MAESVGNTRWVHPTTKALEECQRDSTRCCVRPCLLWSRQHFFMSKKGEASNPRSDLRILVCLYCLFDIQQFSECTWLKVLSSPGDSFPEQLNLYHCCSDYRSWPIRLPSDAVISDILTSLFTRILAWWCSYCLHVSLYIAKDRHKQIFSIYLRLLISC